MSGSARATASWLFAPLAGNGRGLFGIVVLAIVLVTSGYFGWAKYGSAIRQQPQYMLEASSFEITPQPAWIQSDVKADVMRDGRLTKLSALDPDLTKNVVQAFELNTWVAKVLWAGKRPGPDGPRVIVKLRYRRPIIMVWTLDEDWKGDCFYPVDTEGVLLPPDEFSRGQVLNYMRVYVGEATRTGTVGTPYGDSGVTGAAAIAARIGDAWQWLGLQWIVVRKDMNAVLGRPMESNFVLLPSKGDSGNIVAPTSGLGSSARDASPTSVEVIWGHAPGCERPDEANDRQKLMRLRAFVKQNGSLDRLPATTIIDLRPNTAISVIQRSAKFQPASMR